MLRQIFNSLHLDNSESVNKHLFDSMLNNFEVMVILHSKLILKHYNNNWSQNM